MRSMFLIGGALAAGALVATAVASPIVVTNPTFTTPMPGIPAGSVARTAAGCSMAGVGLSASDGWTTFANDLHASITSWLTVAPDGTPANLVSVGGDQGGLVQVMAAQGTATDFNRVSATVYVLGGQASVQIGDGGSGGGSVAVSTTERAWQTISACGRRDNLNNEIVVYSSGAAVFYVSNVKAWFDPKCR